MKMSLTELPFSLPGRIFRSPMPFGDFDPDGKSFLAFKEEKVSVIVLLVDEEESLRKTGLNLKALYEGQGFQVIHLPIRDFSIPTKADLERVVKVTADHARSGRNIVIHCYAGIGRTGLFASCLAKEILGLSGLEAIRWVRKYIPGAVEAPEQKQLILEDDPNYRPPENHKD